MAVVQDNTVHRVTHDHLGTPRKIETGQGTDIWTWPLVDDPFGDHAPQVDLTGNDAPAGFEYNKRFPGQYYDSESGLHYNYFRDYNAATGRYVQSDPIGLRGGINTYVYGLASSLTRVDPLGLSPCECEYVAKTYVSGVDENQNPERTWYGLLHAEFKCTYTCRKKDGSAEETIEFNVSDTEMFAGNRDFVCPYAVTFKYDPFQNKEFGTERGPFDPERKSEFSDYFDRNCRCER